MMISIIKTTIAAAAIILGSAAAWAGSNAATEAGKAYAAQDYNKALELYGQAAKADGVSGKLYYNIANTHYRLKDRGQAILYYERALMLDPSNSQARADLEFVREKWQISEDTGASVVADTVGRLSTNTWATIAVVAFLMTLLLAAAYVAAPSVALRKVGFFGAGATLAVCVVANVCAIYMYGRATSHDCAIVTVPQATLGTAPRQPKGKEVAFKLKEGYKVQLRDSVSSRNGLVTEKWYDVETSDSRRAWVSAKSITII